MFFHHSFSTSIEWETLENDAGPIRVMACIPLNILPYTKNAILLAKNMQDLQNMLNNVITAS